MEVGYLLRAALQDLAETKRVGKRRNRDIANF